MNTISLSELSVGCNAVFEKVKKTGLPLRVTDGGIDIAEIHPPSTQLKYVRNFDSMKDVVKIIGDIISPASDESDWEVLQD